MKIIRKLFHNFSERTIAAVFIAILFSVAGLIGSIYSDEIKVTCPFSLLDSANNSCSQGELSIYAVVFWITLILASTLLARRTVKLKERLDRTISTLRNDIETAPSDDFMTILRTHFNDATSLSVDGCVLADKKLKDKNIDPIQREENAREILEAQIRSVLDLMSILLQKLDKNSDEEYRSNIMVWVPCDSFKGQSLEDLSDISLYGAKLQPRFFTGGGLEDLSGVLVGFKVLSTSSSCEGVDKNFPDGLTLPVPKNKLSKNGHLNALLGAPLAFIDENEYSMVTDSSDLTEWFKQSNYPHQIKDELNEFFHDGEGQHIGSFVSYKLNNIDDIELGIVNFDRSSAGMLRDRKSPLYFQTVLSLFAPLLANLLSKWIETH